MIRFSLVFVLAMLSNFVTLGQCGGCGCPTNEADLANGGVFCGTCNIAVGTNITISAPVTWCSGTLSITGGPGDIILSDVLHILSGTVRAIDGGTGSLDVNNGGLLEVDAGAFFIADDEIHVNTGGEIILNGSASSLSEDIDIDVNSLVTMGPGSSLSAGTGNGDDVLVQGTLIMNGGTVTGDAMNVDGDVITNGATITINDEDITITNTGSWIDTNSTISANNITVEGDFYFSGNVTTTTDFIVDGGTVYVRPGGDLSVGDDLKVYRQMSGGVFVLEFGGSVDVTDNVVNNTLGNGGGTSSEGTILICDTLFVGGDFTLYNTAPNSSVCGCGTGVLVVQGSFADNESPQCDFAACAGGGAICTSATLPVTWLSFEGELLEANNALLTWSTASEINNSGFYIQRALNDLNFEDIGFVEGHGNSREIKTYSYNDNSLSKGYYYYRLKQVDYDGAFSLSKILSIKTAESGDVVIYPNPSSNKFSIVFPDGSEIEEYFLRDIRGALVDAQFGPIGSGIIIDGSNLFPGIYFLTIKEDGEFKNYKLIKK